MQNLRRAKRARQQVAVLWIDLDSFESVNDHWGDPAGDELLIKVACRLNSRMRDTDTVARMGGDKVCRDSAGYDRDRKSRTGHC